MHGRLGRLLLVVGADPVGGVLERGAQLGGGARERGIELGRGHAQVVDGCAVEPGGQLTECDIATVADRGDDLAHRRDNIDVVIHLTSEHGGEIRRAAEVESGEHGGVMVTVTPCESARIA